MSATIPINDLARHAESVSEAVESALLAVARSGWYVLGPELEQFERSFAAYCGIPECVGVANGTDALELALRVVGVEAGDGVVTVANAGGYATNAILAIGAKPVYADVDDRTLTLAPECVESALEAGARAIVVTHLYGRMAEMAAIGGVASARGVPVIEDCAQAHGAEVAGKRSGTWGHVGCFSFYPTKNLGAAGDGGAIVTADSDLAGRLRRLRQYGWAKKYESVLTGGRNSRLDEIQAAVLRAKLPHLDGWNMRRRHIAQSYLDLIRQPSVRLPDVQEEGYVAHLFVVRTPHRDSLRVHLSGAGIASDVHYPLPDYRQPALRSGFPGVRLPITERASQEVLTLPLFPEMTDEEVVAVADAVNRWEAPCSP